MRTCWLVVGVVALVACGSDSTSSDVGRACELLTIEKQLSAPPPAIGTTARSIGSSFVDFLPESESNATVYVAVAHVEELDSIADEAEGLEGVDVTEVLDQDEVYDEFEKLFRDSPALMGAVDASILPASIRVHASTDADLDRLVAWATEDDRIDQVLDLREIGALIVSTVARGFPGQLEELERITDGDLKVAIQAIRTIDDPSVANISTTSAAVSEFMADNCIDP